MAMSVGVTTTNPKDWDETIRPANMNSTWLLSTWSGNIWVDGEGPETSQPWKEEFGYTNALSDGDTVTVTLKTDRSLSIAHDETEVPHVFTGLPDVPLWAVFSTGVEKIQIV